MLAEVKVRLGELVVRAARLQQKGVDSYLQRDLTTLARNHAVADIVLLRGDEDVRRALEEAQGHGNRVHLWGVEAGAPEHNQSRSLIAEADRRWVIPAAWSRSTFGCNLPEPDVGSDQTEAQPPGEAVQEEVSTSPVLESPATSPVRGKVSPASSEDLARLLVAFEKRGPVLPSRPSTGGP